VLAFEDVLRGEERVLVISGDALHDVDLADFVASSFRSGAPLSVVMQEVADPGRYGVATVEDGRVVSFVEKPPLPPGARGLVSCGIYCVECSLLERFPRGRPYDFGADLIPTLAAEGEHVHCYRFEGYWSDIGDFETLRTGNLDALAGHVAVELPADWSPSATFVDPSAVVAADADLRPPVLVGPEARVGPGATLVGPVVVGARADIGANAFVRESVLLEDAVVPPGAVVSSALLALPKSRDGRPA
jgi:NDP-sugar pyrophosphorylase family protein